MHCYAFCSLNLRKYSILWTDCCITVKVDKKKTSNRKWTENPNVKVTDLLRPKTFQPSWKCDNSSLAFKTILTPISLKINFDFGLLSGLKVRILLTRRKNVKDSIQKSKKINVLTSLSLIGPKYYRKLFFLTPQYKYWFSFTIC